MKVFGTLFALFIGGQGVRAVLNGHDVIGCVAITAGLVMAGAAWLIAAKSDAVSATKGGRNG